MLDASVHVAADARRRDVDAHLAYDALHVGFPLFPAFLHLVHQIRKGLRFQIFQGQIVQLNLNFRNTQPHGQRRVDVERFLGNAPLLFR